MKEETKQILAAMDAAPTLYREISKLRKAHTTDQANTTQEFNEIGATLYLITELISAVPDCSIRRMLRFRAVIGMPWSKTRSENGADCLNTCEEYIDSHLDEIISGFRRTHSAKGAELLLQRILHQEGA